MNWFKRCWGIWVSEEDIPWVRKNIVKALNEEECIDIDLGKNRIILKDGSMIEFFNIDSDKEYIGKRLTGSFVLPRARVDRIQEMHLDSFKNEIFILRLDNEVELQYSIEYPTRFLEVNN